MMFMDDHWGAVVLATANATTESDHQTVTIDGFTIESVRRGAHAYDYMAWLQGNRAVWAAGKDRQTAITEAVLTAKSLGYEPAPIHRENYG